MSNDFVDLIKEFDRDLKAIDQIILEFSVGKAELIKQVSHHLISSGGKRIRPILVVISAQACGLTKKADSYDLASAVELIHTATLLHDDVVDSSYMRRGKQTANAIWDNKVSVLVGDYLFSVAFQLMVRVGDIRILDLLSKTSSRMADGEVAQLQLLSNINITKENYLDIIRDKTAILFAASCQAGAMISGANEDQINALAKFGENLGIIFQLVDDILDYYAQSKVLGKNLGDDFFERKITLPVILAKTLASKDDEEFITKIFTKESDLEVEHELESKQDDFQKIISLFGRYQVLPKIKSLIENYRIEALASIEIINDSSHKDRLISMLNFVVSRVS